MTTPTAALLDRRPERMYAPPDETRHRRPVEHADLPLRMAGERPILVLVAHSSALIAAGLVSTLGRLRDIAVEAWDPSRGPCLAEHTAELDVVFADTECLRQWPPGAGGRGPARAAKVVWVPKADEDRAGPASKLRAVIAHLSAECAEQDVFHTLRLVTQDGPATRLGVRSPAAGGLAPGVLRRVTEHIDRNLSSRLELAGLAKLAGLSECHFARAFKQSVGLPPHRYLMTRRIAVAAALVARTDRALSDVALEVGFCDQSHFTRLFSRTVGEPPRAYRRRHR